MTRPRPSEDTAAAVCDSCRSSPDLVQEGQRAGVALQRDAKEVAHRGLHLAPRRRPARRSAGERLDVQALVRLEQLERLERQAGAIRAAGPGSARTGRRPAAGPSGTRSSASSSRSHSTQRSTSGPDAQLVGEVHLVPAGHAARRHARRPAARRRGAAARRAAPPRGAPPGERSASSARYQAVAVDSRRSRRRSQAWPTSTCVTTSKVRPRASARSQLGERLQAAAEPARRAPHALGDGLELAVAPA